MAITDTELIDLLARLSNAKAPSGFEDEVADIARAFCADWADVEVNSLLDITITPRNCAPDKPTLMFDAHGDEVGGMVQSILSGGTMNFVELGHFAPGTLTGQDVWVRTKRGSWVRGVIGVKPPHFWSAAEQAAGKAPLTLDVGAVSKQDAVERFGIGIGEPLVPATAFSYDEQTGIAIGKAFDCRAGVCALLLALRELAQRDDLPVNVVGCISSQEEMGERGAAAAARSIAPAAAFLFEGCPADDTFTPKDEVQTALRQGPMFRYFDRCMITNPRYQRFVLNVADQCGLPVQTAVRTGGGTNAGVIHQLDIPCVVAGIPCRYIHAGTAICAVVDVRAAAVWGIAVGVRHTPDALASFFIHW